MMEDNTNAMQRPDHLRFELREPNFFCRRRAARSLLVDLASAVDEQSAPPPCFASISTKCANFKASIDPGKHDARDSKRSSVTSTRKPSPVVLPFCTAAVDSHGAIHRQQYYWDGCKLRPVDMDDIPSRASSTLANNNNKNTNWTEIPSLGAKRAPSSKSQGSSTRDDAITQGQRIVADLRGTYRASRNVVARWMYACRFAFLPNPSSVTPDYWHYARWRASHRLFSSMSSVFATQSLLLAVGVGAKRSLPAAAAINWVLKDGLGRLGRLSVATRFGESFDSDLKRFRFASSMIYAAALALDYLTPLAPAHFLPMAALANVGKSVGLTTYISTQPAFLRSFAKSENLADIAAKAQAQQMAMDTIGLAVAVTLSALCRHSDVARRALPLAAFPFLITGDLFSIYNELRSINLRTLNKERAEIIVAQWLADGTVPTPREVSAKERLIFPAEAELGLLPLRIGGLEDALRSDDHVDAFLKTSRRDARYVLTIDPPNRLHEGSDGSGEQQQCRHVQQEADTWRVAVRTAKMMLPPGNHRSGQRGALHAALRCDAAAEDVVESLLMAAHLRELFKSSSFSVGVVENEHKHENEGPRGGGALTGTRQCTVWTNEEEVREFEHRAEAMARKELRKFVRELNAQGWKVDAFMLSSKEKRCYAPL